MAHAIHDRSLVAVVYFCGINGFPEVSLRNLSSLDDGILTPKLEGIYDGVSDLQRLVGFPRVLWKLSRSICIAMSHGSMSSKDELCSPPMIQKSTKSARASRLTATRSALSSWKYLSDLGGWMESPPGALPNIPLQAISM